MKNLVVYLVIIGSLCGCAAGLQPYPAVGGLFSDGQNLWEIRIDRGGSQLFAGLLALDLKGDALEAVLLDGTGIKLLEERVSASEGVENVAVLPAVRNKRLAPFLAEGLHRVFLAGGEGGEVCRHDGLFKLCFGEESRGHLVKLKRLGPFVLWSVDYFINNYDSVDVVDRARLASGWWSPSLNLKRSGAGPLNRD
ncbi:MAG: hypothetical protein RQ753_07355 [Desulfurivibrionaceae bacterium]|nr:hypothetical protein [Desulfurivibrionaceae bacterium]